MSGFPLRPARGNFGPQMVDTTPVRDPSRQIGAATFNLLFWQTAGLGLVSPRAVLELDAASPPVIRARAESWNPERLTTGAFADPDITRNDVGDFDVVYPTTVPDENGVLQPLSFAWAMGIVTNPSTTDVPIITVTPLTGQASGVKLMTRTLAAGSADLVDDWRVAIFLW